MAATPESEGDEDEVGERTGASETSPGSEPERTE